MWSGFWLITGGANLFNPRDVKWTEKAKIEIIEKVSRAGIVVVDNSSDVGIKDIILLRGLESAVNILPPQALDAINSRGLGPFTIVIYDENGFEKAIRDYNYESYRKILKLRTGFYEPSMNWFFIWGKSSSFDWYQYTFIHEIGHAYHWSFTDWDYPLDFFATIRGKGEPPINVGENHVEDFAETFTLYFLKPNYLAEKYPLRYAWMENVFVKQEMPMPPSLAPTTPVPLPKPIKYQEVSIDDLYNSLYLERNVNGFPTIKSVYGG